METPTNPTTAVATVPQFALAKSDDAGSRMLQTLQEIGADVFDLPRVKVPAGGITFWSMPDERGDLQPLKSLDGVLIGVVSNLKAWWRVPYGEESVTPPDCASTDGQYGVGWNSLEERPAEVVSHRTKCSECKWNKFGSKRKGDVFGAGKDCSDFAWLFLVRPGDFVPTMVKVPPTSLAQLKKYAMDLAQRGLQRWQVVTSLSLEQDKSTDGNVPYSKLVLRSLGALPPADAERFDKLSQAFATAFVRSAIDPAAFADRQPAT